MLKFNCFILILSVFLFHSTNGKSLIDCPNQGKPGTLVSDEKINKSIFEKIKFRVPESGLLERPISCMLIIDNNNSQNEPVITQGGIGFYYAEITIQPFLLESLNYRIEVYIEEEATTTSATASTSK